MYVIKMSRLSELLKERDMLEARLKTLQAEPESGDMYKESAALKFQLISLQHELKNLKREPPDQAT